MKVIIYELPTDIQIHGRFDADDNYIPGVLIKAGTVQVVRPPWLAKQPEETDDDFLARIIAKDVPPGVPVIAIDDAELPSRRLRNCWRLKAGKVAIDMEQVGPDELKMARRAVQHEALTAGVIPPKVGKLSADELVKLKIPEKEKAARLKAEAAELEKSIA